MPPELPRPAAAPPDAVPAAPPGRGGAVWAALLDGPLPVDAVHRFLADERAGGTCVFVGTSRRWTDGVETDLLTYEAYAPMAEAELDRLAREAARRWGAVRVAALHRTGAVPPPEASVVVGVACAHRAPAFEACRWIIDTLKEDVPIWKTEHGPGGTEG